MKQELSVESIGKEVWKFTVWAEEMIRKALIWCFVGLFRANRELHAFLQLRVGKGLMALLYTASMGIIIFVFIFSFHKKITFEDIVTTAVVDTKIAVAAHKAGLL